MSFKRVQFVLFYTEAIEATIPTQDVCYSAEEEEQIQQHLADLGYMD